MGGSWELLLLYLRYLGRVGQCVLTPTSASWDI